MDFGPTETMQYLQCPTLWKQSHIWEPIGEWTPHMAIGSSIGKGLEMFALGKPKEDCICEAFKVLEERFVENDSWTLNALQKLIEKGIVSAITSTMPDWFQTEKVIGTELDIGHGKIDLLTKRNEEFIITDHKSKLQLKSYYLEKTLLESETSWQMWDYAARVQEMYHPPKIVIRHHIGVLTPTTKWHQHESVPNTATLQRWIEGRNRLWERMTLDKDADIVTMDQTGCDKFGGCPMKTACYTCALDPTKMSVFYNKKEPR